MCSWILLSNEMINNMNNNNIRYFPFSINFKNKNPNWKYLKLLLIQSISYFGAAIHRYLSLQTGTWSGRNYHSGSSSSSGRALRRELKRSILTFRSFPWCLIKTSHSRPINIIAARQTGIERPAQTLHIVTTGQL